VSNVDVSGGRLSTQVCHLTTFISQSLFSVAESVCSILIVHFFRVRASMTTFDCAQ
jgi:hypothetical protein